LGRHRETDLKRRFFSHVDRESSPIGCWLWIGSRRGTNTCPYGDIRIRIGGKLERCAHRISYIWFVGPVPDDLLVLHKPFCNNPLCVNPAHLYLGTYKQNMADMIGLGHHISRLHPEKICRGEQVGASKMTAFKVRIARSLYRRGMGRSTIAKLMGIHYNTLTAIVHFKTWQHI